MLHETPWCVCAHGEFTTGRFSAGIGKIFAGVHQEAGLLDQPGAALRFKQVDCGNIDVEAQAVPGFGAVHRIGDATHELVGTGIKGSLKNVEFKFWH
jgi:hypothetical protein